MELSQYKFKAFIKANCHEVCTTDDLNVLRLNFEEFILDDLKSYYTIVSNEPTYKTISNSYRIPDEYNWNEKYKEEATSLKEFMTIEEIKSIDYLDYEGEKIHSVISQEKSNESGDYFVGWGGEIKLAANGYKQFLFSANEKTINLELIKELDKLILLASIAEKYKCDIWFYDGYFWQ